MVHAGDETLLRRKPGIKAIPDALDVRREAGQAAGAQASGLAEDYSRLFDILPADTRQRREEAYRLRYQVYCRDHAFEDPAAHPGGMERDSFDDHAVHSLLIHRRTGLTVGTVRLILSSVAGRPRPLPIDAASPQPLPCPRATTAEVSRFSISRSARNRIAAVEGGERQVMPFITLGLIRSLVVTSAAHGVRHWAAVMEPSLLRLLSRLGIVFQPFGPLVEYHGLRQPCVANLDEILARVRRERPEVWDVLTQDGTPVPRASGIAATG